MRRIALLLVALVCIGTTWPATPQAQRRGPTISADLKAHRAQGDRIRVIVQSEMSALASLRGRVGGLLRRDLGDSLALELTQQQFEALSKDGSLSHISGDLPVTADMALTNKITKAADVWKGTSGGLLGLGGTAGYTGAGIGVAVLDSGIAPHSAIGTRVVARANFVSWEPDVAGDAFGHGTHVAGAIAGANTKYTTAYAGGSAPGAKLIDVRVLGTRGGGLTSDVIAGIDWVIANKSAYNIGVITLALGHPVTEPSTTDPLCRAVARATAAGITVVASAGNYGLTSTGAPVLGGITSPGNSPLAITVGALDTMGTLDRGDDRVADYSSRGPTAYEFAVKPDVVAPGTRIVSLEAFKSYLSTTYPQWHIAGGSTNAYMKLSGSSMATGVVAGGVALLLQAEPSLKPSQVKTALQMGATFVEDGGLVGGGMGSVNFAASLKIADAGLVTGVLTSLFTTVDSLLGTSSGGTFRDTGTLIDRVYDGSGINLLGLLDLGRLLGSEPEPGVLNLLGLGNPLGSVAPNYLVWGEVAGWSDSYYFVWGNTTIQHPSGQYFVWGNNEYTQGSYFVWGNSTIPPNSR